MKKIKLFIFILLINVVLSGCQEKKFTFTVNTELLNESLTYLISEENQGRLTGTEGNENVMDYIKSKYEEYGLKSPNDIENYEQTYSQKVRIINQEPKLSLLNSEGEVIKEYDFIQDFGLTTYFANSKIQGEYTTGAFLVKDTNEDNRAEYQDKFGLITLSDLTDFGGVNSILNNYNDSIGLIIRYDSLGTGNTPYNYIPVGPNVTDYTSVNNETGKMNILVAPAVYDEIVSEIANGAYIHLKMDNEIKTVETGNIVGYIEGENKHDYVFVTAHLDHVGKNGEASYNPGALDNGSGISALLEIARIVSENKKMLNKTVVFVAFNGEEEGLYGSTYFVNHSPFSLERAQIINLDMVGSTADLPLTINYCSASNRLKTNISDIVKDEDFDVRYDQRESSDHAPFCRNDYSALTLINLDIYNGYHSPDDTMDDVDIEKLGKVVSIVIHYIDQYA